MAKTIKIVGKDIPIDLLVPLHERDINLKTHRGFQKILTSIQTIGLIEPLCVYEEDGLYIILDGYLRYKAFEQLGINVVPCILYPDKEAYTFNRMVNRLSPYQESCMLRKSLEKLDQTTIEGVLGLKSLSNRLGKTMYANLHSEAIKVIDKNVMSRRTAEELTYVNQDRQLEMLLEMKKSNDYSISFARALVVKTPAEQRNKKKKHRRTWFEDSEKKRELVAKLEDIEKRYDFYTNLYRQYTIDLLKLCFYARKLITNEQIRVYLIDKNPEIVKRFENIIFEAEGKKAS